MSDYKKIANDLTRSLQLSQRPIAISFADVPPPGVHAFNGVVPAGCSFWQLAATSMFYTSAKDHELCSIGIHTHHLAQPSPSYQSELQDALQAMSGLDYVRPDEVAAIPVVQHEVTHVLYGPLVEFRMDPDVVILFAHAQQSLILSEAVTRLDKGIPPAMGRPACAVVPQVLNTGRAAMSLGCCGARAYLDVLSESIAMWAFPGGKLEQYCAEVDALARANKTLSAFHAQRKEDVRSGARPTVRQSLGRGGIVGATRVQIGQSVPVVPKACPESIEGLHRFAPFQLFNGSLAARHFASKRIAVSSFGSSLAPLRSSLEPRRG